MATQRPRMPTPCDLAQTRAWVEDYKRWVAGLPAVGDQAQPPDLQALVAHAGGYERITAEQWAEYDRAMGLGGQRIVGAR